jgi:hypothetical protein
LRRLQGPELAAANRLLTGGRLLKVLGARRKCDSPATVRDAIAWALSHIKPTDVIDIGVFQKHRNEIAEDAAIVRDLAARARPR